MRKYLATLVILVTLFACKNKRTLAGNEHVERDEFFAAYSPLKLPFVVSDTNMREAADTNTISHPIFTQFIPDSIFNTPFGKDRKLTIHPIGKIEQKDKETYFATLVTSKTQSAVYLSVYDKNKFTASMPLVYSAKEEGVTTASINSKLTIIINREWAVKGDFYYNRIIYAYNNVGVFTTVLTETNEDRRADAAIINPIDTFPKKFKYSGDYTKGKRNALFLRDGRKPDTYLFFVHFQNDDDNDPCGGELKGELTMTSEKTGTYAGDGDPCILNFDFTSNAITVKETGSCGNYRGIKCFFNDTYTRKKVAKKAAKS